MCSVEPAFLQLGESLCCNFTRDSSGIKSITRISLKIDYLKFHFNLPGVNESVCSNGSSHVKQVWNDKIPDTNFTCFSIPISNNPLCTDVFFMNHTYLFTCYVFLHTEMPQEVGMPLHGRSCPTYLTKSIAWLWVIWWYKEPEHYQSCYSPLLPVHSFINPIQ